jgi:hypothetical protein
LTVLGAALESVLDMSSNGVAILAVSIASRATDDDHPYGHEKFESLGTLRVARHFRNRRSPLDLVLRAAPTGISELMGQRRMPVADGLDGAILVMSLNVNGCVVI